MADQRTLPAEPDGRRWWAIEDDGQMSEAAWQFAQKLKDEDEPRRLRYLESLKFYEQRDLEALSASSYVNAEWTEELKYGIAQLLCDTFQARVAGGQRPVPSFLTVDGDWSTKRRAKRLGRFVNGLLRAPQGPYADAWDLGSDVALDMAIFGTGVEKPVIGPRGPMFERCFPWTVNVDSGEATYRDPVNFSHHYPEDRDKLIAQYAKDDPELEQKIITASGRHSTSEDDQLPRMNPSIEVCEVCRLRVDDDTPGRWVKVINGAVLEDQEYDYYEPPFIFLHMFRDRIGFWSRGLIDVIKPAANELNISISRMQERVRLLANRRTYVKLGTKIEPEALEENEAENIIYYDGDTPPVVEQTPALNAEDIDWIQLLEGICHAESGISQEAAQGTKPPGVDAAAAIRELTNLQDVRLTVSSRRYAMMFVEMGRWAVRLTRDYAEEHSGFKASWAGVRYLKTIAWKDVHMDADQYQVVIEPVAALPTDRAGITQQISEFYNAGVISQPTYLRLVAWPDLQKLLSEDTAEHDYCEELVERYLDAEPGKWDDGRDYEEPEGYLIDKVAALLLFTQHYYLAKQERAPQFNLQLFTRYIDTLDGLIAEASAPPGAGQPPPPGTPGGPGGPAAPPGAPQPQPQSLPAPPGAAAQPGAP